MVPEVKYMSMGSLPEGESGLLSYTSEKAPSSLSKSCQPKRFSPTITLTSTWGQLAAARSASSAVSPSEVHSMAFTPAALKR